MSKTLPREYVWECDYGIRKPLIPILKKLLREQNDSQLERVDLFINNNIYNLEFFIAFTYSEPIEGQIQEMKQLMSGLKLKYRPDLTTDSLLNQLKNKRFDYIGIPNESVVELCFQLFRYNDKESVESVLPTIPLGKMPVFLSHSSSNKQEVEELIPYLNAANLPIWFDKVNIEYGESIVQAVQQGIKDSVAVIFWITKSFLNSNWCKTETQSFLSRYSGNRDVLIISIVDEQIKNEDLPIFLQDLKYIRKKSNNDLSSIANEISPVLRKYRESRLNQT